MDRRLSGHSQGSGYHKNDDSNRASGSREDYSNRQFLDPNQHAYNWDTYGSSVGSTSADHAFHSQSPEYHSAYHSDHADTHQAVPSALPSDNLATMYSSPNSTTSDTTQANLSNPDDEGGSSAEPPKRKRENRYKNAPPSVLSRRRAQNRASQRAYRERKEQRIRDLEILLEESDRKHQSLSHDYSALRVEYEKLLSERQHQQHQQADDQLLGLDFDPESLGFVLPSNAQTPQNMMPNPYPHHHMPGYPPHQ
ncbi:hypothetical protein S40293_11420 [Stachybotrys chartarum IBT 40293]|nr:hypothetical protein S40293_11420 [Stachybotrys chartarum IBT 40293]